MPEKIPRVGDRLFHNSEKPVTAFHPSEGVVYFGRTKASIAHVGGTGYFNVFEIISDLGLEDVYGGRQGWGRRNDWISLPAATACEALQHISTQDNN